METAATRSITTNESGSYVVPIFRLVTTTSRWKPPLEIAEQRGVVLQVGDRSRFDFLRCKSVRPTRYWSKRERRSRADRFREVSNVITGGQLANIAVNGRSIIDLLLLTAFSQINSYVNTPVGGDVARSSRTACARTITFTCWDGGEDDDRGGAGGMSIAPSSDAIAEFRALTSQRQRGLRSVLWRHHDHGAQVRFQHSSCFGLGIQPQRRV